jgi:predicted transposase YdaD
MEDGITPQERAQMFEETGYENHLQLRYEEGKKAGEQTGMQAGQQKERRDIARAMLAQGMAPTLIAQVTGLPPDEVAELGRGGE